MSTLDNFCIFVGDGYSPAGDPRYHIYRALKEMLCAKCKLTIKTGELFTRKEADHKLGLVICLCSSCRPFKLVVRAVKQQSDRFEKEQDEATSGKDMASKDVLRMAVQERLGPALTRHRAPKFRSNRP